MKKSDKILLVCTVSAMALIGLVHLVLSAEYHRGNMLTTKDLHQEQFDRFALPAPGYIKVHGLLRILILPSDSFYIEIEKPDFEKRGAKIVYNGKDPSRPPVTTYHREGDTLVITGANDWTIDKSLDPSYLFNFPPVNVYCRRLKGITLDNCQGVLEGDAEGMTAITARNAVVWIGQMNGWDENRDTVPAYYDSISIMSFNSRVVVNRYAVIRHFRADLDDKSELTERARILEPEIHAENHTRLSISGNTLRKLQGQ